MDREGLECPAAATTDPAMKTRTLPLLAALAASVAVAFVHAHSDEDADPNDLSFKRATPIVEVVSVERSIEHYTTKLGFTRSWDWPDGSDDKTFAAVSNGEVTVFLSEAEGDVAPTWVFYNVNDVDIVHAAYLEAGANVIEAPNDKPWGMREFLVEDLDGNVLRIVSELPHEHED